MPSTNPSTLLRAGFSRTPALRAGASVHEWRVLNSRIRDFIRGRFASEINELPSALLRQAFAGQL